jgi:DnaJ-class molecular chaperone
LEPTKEQQAHIDQLANRHHLVLTEDHICSDGQPALKLTPASFCKACGGDGFRFDEEQEWECEVCEGTGGDAVLGRARVVLASGIEVVR